MVNAAFGGAVADVAGAGYCRHPIRLSSHAADTATGEVRDHQVLVPCKDRREILCPACAEVYRADAFQLVAAGLRGGKGVPPTVRAHPSCFVTLTAPAFGAVHSRGRLQSRPCRPRRNAPVCPHGRVLFCGARHPADDPSLGRPLCPDCFDYDGAVAWNARMSLLWQRTSVAMARALAQESGVAVRRQAEIFRISYVKVVEFQRRGLVHLHLAVRADGPDGPSEAPPPWLDGVLLARAVTSAAAATSVPGLLGSAPVAWGREQTVRVLGEDDRDTVASYLAKYAVKAATTVPGLARRIDDARLAVLTGVDPHVGRLVETAWQQGATSSLADLRLRAHAHTFGYGGHFATKSRHWSTTFSALRGARAEHARRLVGTDTEVVVPGSWRYSGRGYDSPEATRLSEVLAEAIARRPRRIPGSPREPPDVPRREDQGR